MNVAMGASIVSWKLLVRYEAGKLYLFDHPQLVCKRFKTRPFRTVPDNDPPRERAAASPPFSDRGRGLEDKIDALQNLLRSFGIQEVMRTGSVAMSRGMDSVFETNGNKSARPAKPVIMDTGSV